MHNAYKGYKSGIKNRQPESISDKDLLIQYYIHHK